MADQRLNLDPDLPDVEAPPASRERERVVSIVSGRKRKQHSAVAAGDWLKGAIRDDRDRILPNLANVALALRQASELRGAFSFDELQRMTIVDKELPLAAGAEPRSTETPPRPFSDTDASQVQEWLQGEGMPKVARETIHQAIALRA